MKKFHSMTAAVLFLGVAGFAQDASSVARGAWVFLGMNGAYVDLNTDVALESDKRGYWIEPHLALSYYFSKNFVGDLGVGFSYSRLTPSSGLAEISSVFRRAVTTELNPRYRFNENWSLGPSLDIVFGPDLNYSSTLLSSQVNALAGLKLLYETEMGESWKFRAGPKVSTDLTVNSRQIVAFMGVIQIGFPVSSQKVVPTEKTEEQPLAETLEPATLPEASLEAQSPQDDDQYQVSYPDLLCKSGDAPSDCAVEPVYPEETKRPDRFEFVKKKSVPRGLNIDSKTGKVFGTPAGAAGSGQFDVKAIYPENVDVLVTIHYIITEGTRQSLGVDEIDTEKESAKLIFNHGRIHFGTARAGFTTEVASYLKALGRFMAKNQSLWKRISVEGHADRRGPFQFNLKLSKQRAQSVALALVKVGVPKDRIRRRGFGPTKPLDSRNNATAWKKNRRVEIKFYGVKDPKGLYDKIRKLNQAGAQ